MKAHQIYIIVRSLTESELECASCLCRTKARENRVNIIDCLADVKYCDVDAEAKSNRIFRNNFTKVNIRGNGSIRFIEEPSPKFIIIL